MAERDAGPRVLRVVLEDVQVVRDVILRRVANSSALENVIECVSIQADNSRSYSVSDLSASVSARLLARRTESTRMAAIKVRSDAQCTT